MGFDMRWERQPDGEKADVAAARERFFAACTARDEGKGTQATVEELHDALSRTERSYFRLNIGGMGRYVEAMRALGMIKDVEVGRFPQPPEGIDWDLYDRATPEDVDDAGKLGVAARHKAAVEAHLVAGDDAPGIPEHKLHSTNDGWLVTPQECVTALALYDATTDEHRDQALEDAGVTDHDYWTRWIGYLRGAIDHGGFRVR
ncbi:MAG TPA: hypothetical protein VFZ00_28470 [Solirubrobacter sp.]|nr:hypothetical protein [Solirubrobacter sp.]